eukprot:TRINITY_DN5055_c0_g2_i1.p3 TRINITY_DN5055_c0_g2~~TRINITY_DN5055_c0_g2_i1.p3  ORF type:complete len:161 (-),score=64.75 TRINITY_DN5055_c0_g2_i1:227-709(-)
MLRSLVGSEMCIRDRYQRRVRGFVRTMEALDQDIQRVAALSFFEDTKGALGESSGLKAEQWTLVDTVEMARGAKEDVYEGLTGAGTSGRSGRKVKQVLRALLSSEFDLATLEPVDGVGYRCVGQFEQLKVLFNVTVTLGFEGDKINLVNVHRSAEKQLSK